MTKKAQDAQNAYMRGFCKVAEANGVDPQKLYKYAQAMMGRGAKQLGGLVADKARRFWELLKGGNKDIKDTYLNAEKRLHHLHEKRMMLPDVFKNNKNFQTSYKNTRTALRAAYDNLNNEALKVFAARAGAAGGLGLGAYALSGNKQPSYYKGY